MLPAILLVLGVQSISPTKASAQYLEIGGGWAHATGNNGLDGLNAEAAWWFSPRFVATADYDATWDTSHIGVFDFTRVGPIALHSHLQNYLVGGRMYFGPQNVKGYRVTPFGEVQIGASHLGAEVQQGTSDVRGSDTGFTWLLGGGADYRISPHFSARGKLALLRTHLNAEGQSRLRLAIGIAYTFGSR